MLFPSLGPNNHCVVSHHFCIFAPLLVATTILQFHIISYLVLFARRSRSFVLIHFLLPPWSPQHLRCFDTFFSLPLPGRHSHCVVALHVVSPPLGATAIAQRQRIFCFAPLGSHKHCAYSTHVLLFHLPWSPKPSRSVNAFFSPWSPQPSLGRHSHCVVYGRARSPNFHRVFRISRQGHRRVPPPKATGESSRTALGFFGGFR